MKGGEEEEGEEQEVGPVPAQSTNTNLRKNFVNKKNNCPVVCQKKITFDKNIRNSTGLTSI